MEYDGSSEGGPKGSFENFKAEGEVLFKHHEYKKALDSFNTVNNDHKSVTEFGYIPVLFTVYCLHSDSTVCR